MDLATHQRKLLGLVRGTAAEPDDDPYVRRVAESRDLQEARRNVLLWRVYVLERTCPLTVALLRRRGELEAGVGAFMAAHNVSPFRETQPPAFLDTLAGHADALVACVAQFERALTRVAAGDQGSYAFRWQVEPSRVLNALARELPIDASLPRGSWTVVVSGALPHRFVILEDEAAAAVCYGQR